MTITAEMLKLFKQKLGIYHNHKDEYLEDLLEQSYAFISRKCGEFSMQEDHEGAELVYDRARYAYHDSVEYFDENFMSMVMNFSLNNLPVETGDTNDETTV
jgi:hypothetical protein